MNRDCAITRKLPYYTLAEELICAISHGIGAGLAIAALVLCVIRAAGQGAAAVVSAALYGSALVIMFLMSTMYHSLAPNRAKYVFRILNHCSVFLMLACSYIPIALIILKGAIGWSLFGILCGIAVLGIIADAIALESFIKPAASVCMVMELAILPVGNIVLERLGRTGMGLYLAGSLILVAGAFAYTMDQKRRYLHAVWHFAVLAGCILQFFAVYGFILG